MDLHDEARAAQDAARGEIQSSSSLEDLDAVRVKYLGRKGEITLLLRKLGKVEPDKRKEVGGLLNEVKVELGSLIEERKQDLKQEKYASGASAEALDVTLPGRKFKRGAFNPTLQMMDDLVQIFIGMGFSSVEGPEIETEYNNFDALNIPAWHPSRDDHDSFYVADGYVLRTHTSPAQIRVMKSQPPPVASLYREGEDFRSMAT